MEVQLQLLLQLRPVFAGRDLLARERERDRIQN